MNQPFEGITLRRGTDPADRDGLFEDLSLLLNHPAVLLA